MFEKKAFSVGSGYALNKAKKEWALWFYYVNHNLLFGKTTHMSAQELHAACKALRGEAVNWAYVVISAIKDDLWAKRTRNLYVSSVPIYLQVLMAFFLMERKDLLSRQLEAGDTRPLDLEKQKTGEGPSNEVR